MWVAWYVGLALWGFPFAVITEVKWALVVDLMYDFSGNGVSMVLGQWCITTVLISLGCGKLVGDLGTSVLGS